MAKTTNKSIQIPKDNANFKDIEIIIIDEHTYYDLTNGIGYKITKEY